MSPKSIGVAAAVAALLGLGGWWYSHREPPDITEEQAKAKAASELQGVCGEHEGPIGSCADFKLEAEESSPDSRFKWAFRYENRKPEKAQRIIVLVGRKGDASTKVGFFVAVENQGAAVLASGSAPAAESKLAAAEAALSWTLCELPPELP